MSITLRPQDSRQLLLELVLHLPAQLPDPITCSHFPTLSPAQDLRQLLLELVLHLPAQLPDLIGLMPKLMKLVVQALQVRGGGVRPLRGSGKDMVGPCFGSAHFLHFHPPRSFTLV